jgi:ribosomal protein S12 methylthiotransferase
MKLARFASLATLLCIKRSGTLPPGYRVVGALLPTPRMASSRIHFVSLGCPKNRVDSEVMVGVAESNGYTLTNVAEEADVVVVNTCGFIGEAKKESIATIFELSELRRTGKLQKLVVAGCLSQRYPTSLESEMPEVDHFLGSSDMLKLGQVLSGGADRMLVGKPADWVVRASDPRVLTGPKASAYVKLAEGCNRTCAFCTIPEFRGKQRSRPLEDIVREVEALAAQGVLEINLISQDTIAYGRDFDNDKNRPALAQAIQRIADVTGIRWVRVFYLYPEILQDDLVEVLAQHPKVVKYVDMPLQHAADAMLKRMRRGCGQDRQKRVVDRLRTSIPGLTFRSAFIVGHPGETDAEFDELLEFVEWAGFERLGVFRYSDEESARSFKLEDKVPAAVASARYRKLMSLGRKIARKHQKSLVGKELQVLVEGASTEHEFVMQGRHAGQAPEIDGNVFLSGDEALPGEMRRVLVAQASDYDLVGELLPRERGSKLPKRKQAVRLNVL